MRATQNEIEGSFVVGCHASVGAFTLPHLLRNLQQHAPRLSLRPVHDFSRKITEGVVSYAIDLGYVVNPPRHPDLVMKKLGVDRVTFWRKKGDDRLPKSLIADGSREQVEELLGKTFNKHFRGWQLIPSTNLELIRTLTREGLGVGILPERVAAPSDSGLVLYDHRLPSRPDEIFLIYRKEVLRSKAGQELLKHALFDL